MTNGALLLKTAAEAATATLENGVRHVLVETPLIKTISNGDVKCVYTEKYKNRKRKMK